MPEIIRSHDENPPLYLTEKELAARWRCSRKTLQNRRWRKDSLQCRKINGRILYSLCDIEAHENATKYRNTSEYKKPKNDHDEGDE